MKEIYQDDIQRMIGEIIVLIENETKIETTDDLYYSLNEILNKEYDHPEYKNYN